MTKKAHLIGICGAGMSAVAHLLQQSGFQVSGSDQGFYPPVSDYIKKLDLPCFEGYQASNIPEDVDLIVIGKNAKLVPETNEEVAHALNTHKDKVQSFPEVLGNLSVDNNRVVIAGSYGKSTLTSIVTWCLVYAGLDPSYFIGAVPKNLNHSSSIGSGAHFIFEGDEYPSANWDDRSKFEHYLPHTVILTSACHDHVNIFPTLEDYHAPFHKLLEQLAAEEGTLIACGDEENAKHLFDSYEGAKRIYGLNNENEWYADNVEIGEISRFSLIHNGESLGTISTTQLGLHNIQNFVGAAAWLLGDDILSFDIFAEAIENYLGLTRRLDKKSEISSLIMYEGFGSSYEKARAAIKAMKAHFAEKKLNVFFEPHTFSWRNRTRLDQYRSVFNDVDHVYIYEPPTQGADTHDQLSLKEIMNETQAHHQSAHAFDAGNYEKIISALTPPEDVVLILSSGAFDGLLQKMVSLSEEVFPKA